jgi:nucleotide-binding universal stress UspA family protein
VITPPSRSSVVVGIDGSQAAIDAAQWAVDEAADRDIPLRLVYVIDEKSSDMSVQLQYAESALLAATRAVQATAKPVGIETSIIYGSVLEGLAEESKAAVMICVGSVGIGRVTWKLLGSTAASLANTAHCPVAIIRRHAGIRRLRRAPIAVAVERCADSDPAIELAAQEASLHHAPSAGGRRTRRDVDFLAHADETAALAVVPTDRTTATNLVGHHARCSPLVVPTEELNSTSSSLR